ncbi:hypothetical protein TYRP_010975 [Tyrophagus putrescentiae]|nr:hypothetical protein TYRP_010975 [Tyrophagus putrescentiae]
MDRRAVDVLQNKRFFLEVKNSPQLLLTLTKNIKELGGLIESFLSKNVNYVVTNRPKAEWPQKAEPQSSTAAKISSNQQFALSRASKMLQSTQNVPKTTDPLEMARKYDKKILFANDLLEFLKKYSSGTQADADKAQCTGEIGNRKLCPPFIKVVDKSNKFKTNFKELPEWPEINFDYQPELCPFYKPRKFPNPSQTRLLSWENQMTAFPTVLTTPIMTTPTLNINQIRSIPTKNASTKRKHMVFCEICHKEYNDLEEHLNDEVHSTFLNTENNFSELIGVINSLPPFITATPAKVKRNSRSSNKSITDISNLISREGTPSMPPPPPSDSQSGRKVPSPEMLSIHSINKWESKHGHGFMALHNLVNDENNEIN